MRRRLLVTAVAFAAAASAAPASATPGPGAFSTRGAWKFVSAPRLHPPRLLTQGRVIARRLARGAFLLDNFPNLAAPGPMTGQGGPLIVNQKLQPVWFHPVGTHSVSGDLQQETYQGQPVLVWWEGALTGTGATLRGEVVVVDQHYRRLATLRAHRPWVISLHDAVISGRDIWVTVYRNVHNQDLVPYGGRRHGTVYDAGVQEYDLTTGRLLYRWDALNPGRTANVPLSASEQPASVATAPGSAWDAYHLNSIQVLPGNQILISMRNTSAAYLIQTDTGRIVWTLGGKHSSFRFGRGARFAWQHHVQLISADEVTLFDDACCRVFPGGRFGAPDGPSRGMVLRLDFARGTASRVAGYSHRPGLDTAFLGSMQLLPGGNAVVGWGSLPYFSEYSPSGRQLLDVRFPGKDQSYRALYTSTWIGTPHFAPSGAARRARRAVIVYASWNGATQVSRWRVLAGSRAGALRPVATRPKAAFETAITLTTTRYRVFAVRALDATGHVLGTSRAFR